MSREQPPAPVAMSESGNTSEPIEAAQQWFEPAGNDAAAHPDQIDFSLAQNVAQRLQDRPIEEAILRIGMRDAIDPYAQRLRGQAAGKTRLASLVGAPVGAVGLIGGTATYGPQLLVGGTATLMAGAAASSLAYGAHRYNERRRVKQGAEHQELLRQGFDGEPVDLIRYRRKAHSIGTWNKRDRVLRWYGGDQVATSNGTVDEAVAERFAQVVETAQRFELQQIAVSKAVADHILNQDGEAGEGLANSLKLDQYTTTPDQLMEKAKGVRIIDRQAAGQELVVLPMEVAGKLTEQLRQRQQTSRIDVLAQWLVASKPDHPARQAYEDWLRLGKPQALTAKLTSVLQTSIERQLGALSSPEPIRLVFNDDSPTPPDGIPEVYDGIRRIRQRSHEEFRVNHRGVSQTTQAGLGPDLRETRYSYTTFDALAGKSMPELLQELAARRSQDLKEGKATAYDTASLWKLELALYYALLHDDRQTTQVRQSKPTDGPDSSPVETLYDRILREKPQMPRSWPLKTLRTMLRGDKRTVGYERAKHGVTRKLGAVAAVAAISWGLSDAAAYSYDAVTAYESYCNPEDLGADNDSCQKPGFVHEITRDAVEPIIEANDQLENAVLTNLFASGLITPELAQQFSEMIGENWAQEKFYDLMSRLNLYGSDISNVGNVTQGPNNPTMWELSPTNGATTQGYWPSHVQNNLSINSYAAYGVNLPPLSESGLQMRYEPGYNFIASSEHIQQNPALYYFGGQPVRFLDVPRSLTDDNRPLIGVRGRLSQTLGSPLNILEPGQNDNLTGWSVYALPVKEGSDIVAADITIRDLLSDEVVATPEIRVFQDGNGTFRIAIPIDTPLQPHYLDVAYWLDPAAVSDEPVRAITPMVVTGLNDYYTPLNAGIDQAESSAILAELGLPPQANFEQIVEAVRSSRDYSYTPYDQVLPHEPITPEMVQSLGSDFILSEVAKYAAQLDTANCNVATLITLIASLGDAGGHGFANQVVGINNNGDNALTTAESHAWLVTSQPDANGQTFHDATPAARHPLPEQPPAPYEDAASAANDIPYKAVETIKLLAMIGLGLAAYRQYPRFADAVRRRRRQTVLTAALQDIARSEAEGTLNSDLNLINHVLYAGDQPFDEAAMPDQAMIREDTNADLGQRLSNLKSLKPQQLQALIDQGRQSGQLSLSDATAHRLVRLTRHAKTLQPLYSR